MKSSIRTLALTVCLSVTSQAWSQTPSQTADKSTGTRPASPVYPLDGVVDSDGTVWIVDRNLPGLWKYANDKLEVSLTGAKKFRQPLNAVRCIGIDKASTLYLGDPATREIYRRTGTDDPKPMASGVIGIPMDIAISSDGTLYVADVERRVIWKLAAADERPTVFAEVNPRGLFMDAQDRLWVISQNQQQLLRIDAAGNQEVLVKDRVFEFPHQIVVDASGTAWISDGYKKALWRMKPDTAPEIAFSGEPFKNPVGLFLVDDKPVIVDPHAQSVFKWNGERPELWFQIAKP